MVVNAMKTLLEKHDRKLAAEYEKLPWTPDKKSISHPIRPKIGICLEWTEFVSQSTGLDSQKVVLYIASELSKAV